MPAHDGELEPGMFRRVFTAAHRASRHHHHHGHGRATPLPPLPSLLDAFEPLGRHNAGGLLRPGPDVYPLVAAVGLALALAGVLAVHDLRPNHEVFVRKDARAMQVCAEDDEEHYRRVVALAKRSYDNPLRRRVLGLKPWIFPKLQERVTGIPRVDTTVDLERDEKWTKLARRASEEHHHPVG